MSTKPNSYDETQIQVLEGLEAVRKRPGMYIGSTGPAGLHHLVYEVLDNSIDEALAGYCKNIVVEILPGDIIRVVDDGRGIPVGIQHKMGIPAVTVVFTVLHAGGKFGGGGYKVSGGLHGVGASVVNALSEYLEVEVCDGQQRYRQRFERGAVASELIVEGKADFTGTTVTFKPDGQIFEELEFDYDILLARIREQAFLNAGLCIRLVDSRGDEIRQETLCYEGGIRQFVTWLQERRAVDPLHDEVIYLSAASGDDFVEIAMQYNNSYNETLLSFANNIHTGDGGTHEVGFKAALTRVMNDYARRTGAIKDADKSKNLSGDDVREGLTAIISVKLLEPQFEGQTKAKLGNTSIRSLVDGAVSEKLSTFLEENPAVAKAILDKALAASRAREAAKRAREAERKKSTMENTRLPGKLADCAERGERTEIYIVEGDSAGGSAKQGRDRNFQAILPLWGKMLNVERSRLDKVYGNDKLMPVVVALGCGLGEDFDVAKLRYNKVVIMADADVDGSHIRTLLLTFFFRFMRPLIEHGHVYIAQPPLYKLSRGKLVRYAYSDEERDRLSQELFEGKAELQRYKGLGEMNPEQLWETTMDPATRIMLKVHMADAIKADETFSILMGDKVGPRKEFIEQNAKYVVNLDV